MQRKIVFSIGEYYHLYNRGVDKRLVFLSEKDRQRFLKLLYLANNTESYKFDRISKLKLNEILRGQQIVSIGAYVLMPNHFHILVKEVADGGISSFMEKLTTGYTMYFNKKEDRSGALFQGTFKAEHVSRDEHLKYLFAYIHLNPVKLIDAMWKERGIRNLQKAKHYLSGYKYSSYLDYLGVERESNIILSRTEFPEYFQKSNDFEDFIGDWLTYTKPLVGV